MASTEPPSSTSASKPAHEAVDVECGKIIEHSEFVMGAGCSGSDCFRNFKVYVPSVVCDTAAESRHQLELPLVIALHCFTCTAESMYDKNIFWPEMAETFRFVAVFPEGIDKSWNGVNCCGHAVTREVDDVRFLEELVSSLTGSTSDRERNSHVPVLPFVSSKAHYATGVSNGAFLATHAAYSRPMLFRAIAPVAGFVNINEVYEQEHGRLKKHGKNNRHPSVPPVAVLMNHAINDQVVQYEGCCSDTSMPTCCCLISDSSHHAPKKCLSAPNFAKSWASKRNRCSADAVSNMATTVSFDEDFHRVSCTSYADGCSANTTICTHESGGHFSGGQDIQAKYYFTITQISHFFAHDACVNLGGGTWSRATKTCRCVGAATTVSGGVPDPFCLAASVAADVHLEDAIVDALTDEKESLKIIHILSIALVALTLAVYRRYRRGRARASTSASFEMRLT